MSNPSIRVKNPPRRKGAPIPGALILDLAEAAADLRVPARTVRALIASGQLPTVRLPLDEQRSQPRVLIARADLVRFVEQHRTGASRSLFDAPSPAFDGDQLDDPRTKPVSREGFTRRVAELFRARPGEWIDGRTVMKIAGSYAWRTRISDCRQPPFDMRIVNRQRHVRGVVISEYHRKIG